MHAPTMGGGSCGNRLREACLAWVIAAGAAGPATAQTFAPEVQVGTHAMIDYEFDWGRDGVYCPTCNYGAGNARLTYIDDSHNVWVGYVDVTTGNFLPSNGQAVLVDTNAATAQEIGNGSEWMFSQRGSEIVYTRWTDGKPHVMSNLNLGFARMGNGSWLGGPVSDSQERVLPIGSLTLSDQTPAQHFQSATPGSNEYSLYWRAVTPGSVEHPIPVTSTNPAMTRRWVLNTTNIIITAPAAPDSTGTVYDQVFLYHTKTGVLEQLTSDPVEKLWAWMWPAPEYGNENLFFVVVGGDHLNIYRDLPAANGSSQWTVINSIAMPAATPTISSPEPFVLNGHSWIFFTLSSNPDLHDFSATSLVAMTGIVPGTSTFKQLTSDNNPPRARRDPEYFITANGPYIYYNRYIPATATSPQVNEGVFRVDTGLGPLIPSQLH
jgi:hypothetical protein